tara:strand:- start:39449 stop:39874 length:426 start_codon:yes stop_codon:yes gene_type:complete
MHISKRTKFSILAGLIVILVIAYGYLGYRQHTSMINNLKAQIAQTKHLNLWLSQKNAILKKSQDKMHNRYESAIASLEMNISSLQSKTNNLAKANAQFVSLHNAANAEIETLRKQNAVLKEKMASLTKARKSTPKKTTKKA